MPKRRIGKDGKETVVHATKPAGPEQLQQRKRRLIAEQQKAEPQKAGKTTTAPVAEQPAK